MNYEAHEVKKAVEKAGIIRIDHHQCGLCGGMVYYSVDCGNLYFNSGCDCSWSPPQQREWSAAANWINMQTSSAHRNKIAASFGLPTESV